MNDLETLRSTLAREADAVADHPTHDAHARPAAVRARVQVVRRRRRAAAGIALVVVLVTGVVGVAGLGGGRRDVPPADGPLSVLGVDVPRSVEYGGFPYALSGEQTVTVPETGIARVEVTPGSAERPRAYSLVATGLGDGTATLLLGGSEVGRVYAADGVAFPADLGTALQDIEVRVDGAPADARVALVTYEWTGELPPGITDGSRVLRQRVAGDQLLAGAFSDPGQDAVDVPFQGADARLTYACSATARGLTLDLRVDDGPVVGSVTCGEEPLPRDAALALNSAVSDLGPGSHVLRAELTVRENRPPRIETSGARFVVGVYEYPRVTEVPGQPAAVNTVEYAGRTWRLERVVQQPAGGGVVREQLPVSGDDRLLGFAASSMRRGGGISLSIDGVPVDGAQGAVGGITTPTSHLFLAGDTGVVTLGDATDESFTGAILIYRPLS